MILKVRGGHVPRMSYAPVYMIPTLFMYGIHNRKKSLHLQGIKMYVQDREKGTFLVTIPSAGQTFSLIGLGQHAILMVEPCS